MVMDYAYCPKQAGGIIEMIARGLGGGSAASPCADRLRLSYR